MGDIGLQELLLILVIALMVFGPKRLPELGRALGRAIREFRRASEEVRSTLETHLQLNEPDPALSPSGHGAAEPPPPPVETAPGPAPEAVLGPHGNGTGDSAERYQAKRGARLFHARECGWTAGIKEAERVYFKRVAEAREQGLAPCPVCAPWEPE